jgi:HAD superfamily, subfamily IIIB (Acid phosphatase)
MRFAFSPLIFSVFLLQGCAAALLPVAAAGVIGKTRIDAAKRVRNAEAGIEKVRKNTTNISPPSKTPRPVVTVGGPEPAAENYTNIITPVPGDPELGILTARALPTPSRHPYLDFARFAQEQVKRRDKGLAVQSVILVKSVSLVSPQTIGCGAKPLAVIIDIDDALSTLPRQSDPTRPLGSLLEDIRNSGIQVIWISGRRQNEIERTLGPLREGQIPAIKAEDLISFAKPRGIRKQERRWSLGQGYCIVAAAGDQKSDFDELYDYLRNPDYAVALDKFWNRGWFIVPPPSAAAAPEIEDITQKLEQNE